MIFFASAEAFKTLVISKQL